MRRMKIIYRATLLAVSITITGCETIVDVDIPREPPKLVVNSTLHPDDYFRVHLTQSQYILKSDDYLVVPGATVEVFADGNYLTTLPDSANGNYISATYKPQLGKTYELRVSKAGFADASARVTLPKDTARILGVKLDTVELSDFGYTSTYLRFSITLDDDEAADNFYQVSIFKEAYAYEMDYNTIPPTKLDSTLYREKLYIESRDPGLEEYQNYGAGIVFNDKLFNGREYEMRVLSQDYYNGEEGNYPPTYYVVIASTSESYYLYELSTKLQYWVDGDPFAQPVIVYNNIVNGYGIFSAYNEVSYTVKPF